MGTRLDGALLAAASLPTETVASPVMEAVNAPARIVRIAVRPGSNGTEAWAFGYTSAIGNQRDPVDPLGQVVFLHWNNSAWQLDGVPVNSSGGVENPRLTSIAASPTGDVWAVGAGGVTVHRTGGRWAVGLLGVKATIEAVTLSTSSGGAVSGYAVGDKTAGGITVFSLVNGGWQQEASGVSGPDLVSVSISPSDPGDVWAVSGDSSPSLVVMHRSGGSWSPVSTHEAMFDSPPAATQNDGSAQGQASSSQNQAANGGAIAAVGDGTAWVVGRIDPTDNTHPFGDAVTGDTSRPFAIHLTAAGVAHSYCPALDTVGVDSSNPTGASQGTATQQKLCDENFPLAAFGLTTVQSFDGGQEVFAGGMGLFHFQQRSGSWSREADPVGYLSDMSLDSPSEGWVSGPGGNTITRSPVSETLAVAHWTTHPTVPAVARWPQPVQSPLEGVAVDPGGSGQALAVGGDGVAARFFPGHGWQQQVSATSTALHAIAWPSTGSAWAVGNGGTVMHWDGFSWSESRVPLAGPLDERPNLYGVAFTDAGHGWAVGDGGGIYAYSGGRWHVDRLHDADPHNNSALYTVVATAGGVVAAGAGGTVLVNRGSGWQEDTAAENLARQPGTAPAGTTQPVASFFAAARSGGTIALGGSHGVILTGTPGALTRQEGGPDGTITALAMSGGAFVAAVSPRSETKYVGGQLGTTEGWVMLEDSAGWRDVEFGHQLTMWASTDTAAQRDAVYAVALEPGSLRGWAVGGYPALTADDDTRSYQRSAPAGSTYRVDIGGNPLPPGAGTRLPAAPRSGFTFAFLGESACAAGVCSAALGTGQMSDVALLQAQEEIDAVSPALTFYGGDMRRTGLPEELDEFKRFIGGFTMPVYAAMGAQDLVSGLDTGQLYPGAPSRSLPGSNGFYEKAFADQKFPWGNDPRNTPAGVAARTVAEDGTFAPGLARTHYAFDYQPDGLPPSARFIVLNTSEGTLEKSNENPSLSTNQLSWLGQEIDGAKAAHLPAIVVMNLPPTDPRGTRTDSNTLLDGTAFDATIQAHPPAVVIASGITANLEGTVPTTSVPLFISGGAGSPLAGDKRTLHGDYHAWLLLTLDPAHPTPTGQIVTAQAMPVLESIALEIYPHAGSLQGGVPAGSPLTVRDFGRLPDAGLGNLNGALPPDIDQSRAQYMEVPDRYQGATPCFPAGSDGIGCTIPGVKDPSHRFWSEDDSIAAFVKPYPSPNNMVSFWPDSSGNPIPDDQDGFLCTFKAGKVWIDSVVGIRAAREQITVTPGGGHECHGQVPHPGHDVGHAGIVIQDVQPVVPQPQPPPVTIPVPRHHSVVFHPINPNLVPAVLPPPVPVLAAAPPLPAAGTAAKKEEEREKAFEHSKEQGDGHKHQAVAYSPPGERWTYQPIAVAGAASLLMLILMSAWASARRRPEAAIDTRRWE